MARLWLGVAAAIAGLAGCAAPAHYVEQHPDSGVVAIPDNTDTFPSFSRTEALSLIEKHVGPNYEIIDERPVTATRKNFRNQHAQTEHVPDPNRIAGSAPINQAPENLGTHQVTEWRIAYRKRSATWLGEGNPGGATATAPIAGEIQQTQGVSVAPAPQLDSLVPSVAPVGGCVGGCPNGRCNTR